MSKRLYKLTFKEGTSMDDVEETLELAILACEGIHGHAAVVLGFAYTNNASAIVLDATTDIGLMVCRIFVCFCSKEFGEGAFVVTRPEEKP